MKKRFLSLLCVLVFALPFVAATPCFANTGETTIGQITYQYDTETDEAMVTHADSGISGDVEIPGTIEVTRNTRSPLSGIMHLVSAQA